MKESLVCGCQWSPEDAAEEEGARLSLRYPGLWKEIGTKCQKKLSCLGMASQAFKLPRAALESECA